jgi:hypothetical protein
MYLSIIPPPGRTLDEGMYDCIAQALTGDPHLSARRIAEALDINSTTV